MKMTYFIASIMCLIQSVCSMAQIAAHPQTITPNISDGSVACDSTQHAYNNFNYKHFEINVSEAGNYYAEFWLLPAKYGDGTYTRFTVYVNNEFVGHISPDSANWQSARIDGNARIAMQKGNNVITIAVPDPEIPMVETFKVSLTDTNAAISSAAYEEYCKNAAKGLYYHLPSAEQSINYATNTIQPDKSPEFPIHQFSDVPLLYTFFTEFDVKTGDCIRISTSSLSEHDVDVMYIRHPAFTIKPKQSTTSFQSQNINPVDKNSSFKIFTGPDASSEEMQGLNWKGISTKSTTTQTHRISKTISFSQPGTYLFRLRHRQPGKTGIAHMYISANYRSYMYENVPISYSYVDCEMPANDKEYGTMTICDNPDEDDPVLFIHGAAADRIVGFNDNADYIRKMVHELSDYDSHIMQQYQVKTSGISVSNANSLTPESSCYIIAGIDESIFDPGPEWEFMPKYNETLHRSKYTDKVLNVNISDQLEHNGVITITSDSPIHNVTITDLSGNTISSFQQPGTELSISKELMKIGKSGIYIMSVNTDNGITSKKLLFK